MASPFDYDRVLAAYPAACQPQKVHFLGSAGGFSGARFWRLETCRGPLCLRRWPREHPQRETLEFIHAVLCHVQREGFRRVPVPLETLAHARHVSQAGYLWELVPWMPGHADYRANPSHEKLENAMTALAQFHQAAASFPLAGDQLTRSAGIQERLDRLRRLAPAGLEQLARAAACGRWPQLAERAQRLPGLFALAASNVRATLSRAAGCEVPLQPCIRDIWHDHVLFVGQEVAGLIDFGAMRPESVAADVARLLGSLVGDDAQGWQHGLAAYQAVRPLSAAEALVVTAFDQSTVLLAGVNWLEWIYEEQRQFENLAAVLDRLDEHLARLAHLAGLSLGNG